MQHEAQTIEQKIDEQTTGNRLKFKLEAIARCLLVDLLLDGLCFMLHCISFLVE